MTLNQAKRKSRELAKKNVRIYFASAGIENFKISISLLKCELSYHLKVYFPHYVPNKKQWVVMSLSGKIYE